MALQRLTAEQLVGLSEELTTLTGFPPESAPAIGRLLETGNHGSRPCRCSRGTQQQCLDEGPKCAIARRTTFLPIE